MQRLITKALATAVATAALIATGAGIASAANGQDKLAQPAKVCQTWACEPWQDW
ncbi:hypothetical protein QQM39_43940 [Streptomyces sp. DT2A-34]|uniref:hypothetical protein n=1 Tax=Streptomyces sp. DT2A-34 TaxID=3051182 RepID=UPI00265BB13F|nr:hypothetical protein [Streptomyces sp. DT2A-34]MDO0917500.1 hypothetical protein [Streptomyces sp. DT2A-34]